MLRHPYLKPLAAAMLAVLVCPLPAAQEHRADPDTGARTWATKAHGVAFSLTQILPDQVRAFYLNRGFSEEAAEEFATACVFMTVLRNDNAPGTLHFRTADWVVASAEGRRAPLSVDYWKARFDRYSLPPSALLAFRWAQIPPEQSYRPGGDWNQGMLSTGLAPGASFDMIARWRVDDTTYEARLDGVHCAR